MALLLILVMCMRKWCLCVIDELTFAFCFGCWRRIFGWWVMLVDIHGVGITIAMKKHHATTTLVVAWEYTEIRVTHAVHLIVDTTCSLIWRLMFVCEICYDKGKSVVLRFSCHHGTSLFFMFGVERVLRERKESCIEILMSPWILLTCLCLLWK